MTERWTRERLERWRQILVSMNASTSDEVQFIDEILRLRGISSASTSSTT